MSISPVTNSYSVATAAAVRGADLKVKALGADAETAAAAAAQQRQEANPALAKVLDSRPDKQESPVESTLLTDKKARENRTKPPGVVHHVVVSYNQFGKVRTKFMDSRNNVVYQVPSELVARVEDLMLKPENSTNTTG